MCPGEDNHISMAKVTEYTREAGNEARGLWSLPFGLCVMQKWMYFTQRHNVAVCAFLKDFFLASSSDFVPIQLRGSMCMTVPSPLLGRLAPAEAGLAHRTSVTACFYLLVSTPLVRQWMLHGLIWFVLTYILCCCISEITRNGRISPLVSGSVFVSNIYMYITVRYITVLYITVHTHTQNAFVILTVIESIMAQ